MPAADVSSLTVRDSTVYGWASQGLIRSTDGGEHWSSPTPGLGGERVNALITTGPDTGGTHLFVGTENNGLYRSTNEGQTWEAVNSGIEDTTVWCLAEKDSNLFAGAAGGVYLSTNGGDSWSLTSRGVIDAPVRGLAVIGETVVAGTEGQGVFLSTDCGTQWRQSNNGLSDLNVLCLVARGSKMFAGTWFADVYLSEDSGSTWTRVDEGYKKVPILALEMTDTDLFIGSRGGGVWRRPLSEMRAQVIAPSDDVPIRFDLGQNYPNPFNPSTTIEYDLPTQSHVELRVFNMLGQEVAVLVDEFQPAGYKSVEFKAEGLPSGVYLYRLTAGGFVATKKLVLLK